MPLSCVGVGIYGWGRSIDLAGARGLLRFGDRPLLVSGAFDCQQMDPPVNGLVGQGITKTSELPKNRSANYCWPENCLLISKLVDTNMVRI